MKLSRWFNLEELLHSESAPRLGIDMTPNDSVTANLMRLCLQVLDPIRERAGAPIIVTSGYRPRLLNEHVGGERDSDHLYGCAADIRLLHGSADQLMSLARDLNPPAMHKAIVEFGSWVHVSVARPGKIPAGDWLVASLVNGKKEYTQWLES